ncbi:hypothetical protein FAVG1_03309 [Fusarium avenaceum]|nr:hypothetical protein FAVG1_03309 [Fusarium avenaceum]
MLLCNNLLTGRKIFHGSALQDIVAKLAVLMEDTRGTGSFSSPVRTLFGDGGSNDVLELGRAPCTEAAVRGGSTAIAAPGDHVSDDAADGAFGTVR